MRTMVLVYLPTWLGDFVRENVGKSSSTMEHWGNVTVENQNPYGVSGY